MATANLLTLIDDIAPILGGEAIFLEVAAKKQLLY
jgi:predicted DNA repair protein MutK